MKLSMVIVSWNVSNHLYNCLKSVYENSPAVDFEIIVVDNNSSDDTVIMVKDEFSDVKLLESQENFGFSKANNKGVEISSGEYVLFLNPDTIVHSGALEVLLDVMDDDEQIGACGPKLLNPDGSIQECVGGFPTFRTQLYSKTLLRHTGLFRKHHKIVKKEKFDYNSRSAVEHLSGAALVVRKSVLQETGLFDTRFFLYFEDSDLCYRICEKGYKLIYQPKSVITHIGGESTKQLSARDKFVFNKSLMLFFRKHRGYAATAMFNIVFKPGFLIKQSLNLISSFFYLVFHIVFFSKEKARKHLAIIRKSSIFLFRYSLRFVFI